MQWSWVHKCHVRLVSGLTIIFVHWEGTRLLIVMFDWWGCSIVCMQRECVCSLKNHLWLASGCYVIWVQWEGTWAIEGAVERQTHDYKWNGSGFLWKLVGPMTMCNSHLVWFVWILGTFWLFKWRKYLVCTNICLRIECKVAIVQLASVWTMSALESS